MRASDHQAPGPPLRSGVPQPLDGQPLGTTVEIVERPTLEEGSVSDIVMFSLNVKYKNKTRKKKRCDLVDFALVNYLSVHAHHHFYM